MTKRERVLQRQMELFQYIKDNSHYGLKQSNDTILSKLAHIYNSKRTLQNDLDILEQKFLITRKIMFSNPTNKVRVIKVIDRSKELLSQCSYDYIEALALANPHCFLIKWRDGYQYHKGGVQKYVDYKPTYGRIIGTQWEGTGMWLLKEPSELLSSKPITKDVWAINSPDYKDYLDTRPLAF